MTRCEEQDQVIAQFRRRLVANPDDKLAIGSLANALRAKGEYLEAIHWLERLDVLRKQDEALKRAVPGDAGFGITIACLQWMLGNRSEGISRMHDMVQGILNGSIQYGDAAGGMRQGLLLHYMGVTGKETDQTSYALHYLRSRVNRLRSQAQHQLTAAWPCSLAQYLIGEIGYDGVVECINREGPFLNVLDAAARKERLRRFRLAEAVFHDGVKSRADGDEESCVVRMKECCRLVDPPISHEDYLARHELKNAAPR